MEPISVIQVRQCSLKSTIISFVTGFSIAVTACYFKPELPRKAKEVALTALHNTRSLILKSKHWLKQRNKQRINYVIHDNDSWEEVDTNKPKKDIRNDKSQKKKTTKSIRKKKTN